MTVSQWSRKLLPAPGDRDPVTLDRFPLLMPERIGQLPANLGGKRLIVHAIVTGQLIFRHPEGSENDIPDRKRPGKVGIAALFERGVMPTVKDPRGKTPF